MYVLKKDHGLAYEDQKRTKLPTKGFPLTELKNSDTFSLQFAIPKSPYLKILPKVTFAFIDR